MTLLPLLGTGGEGSASALSQLGARAYSLGVSCDFHLCSSLPGFGMLVSGVTRRRESAVLVWGPCAVCCYRSSCWLGLQWTAMEETEDSAQICLPVAPGCSSLAAEQLLAS